MKKAQFIPFNEKKDQQVLDDMRMSPEERFMKMIELIELSIALSPTGRLKVYTDDRFIELKNRSIFLFILFMIELMALHTTGSIARST